MRPNFVYVIAYGERDMKVGVSVSPPRRLLQLRGGGAARVVECWPCAHGEAEHVERIAHRLLAPHRLPIAGGRERFAVQADAAQGAVRLGFLLAREEREDERQRREVAAVAAAEAAGLPPLPRLGPHARHLGYVVRAEPAACSGESDLLVAAGVPVADIYVDVGGPGKGLRAAVRACQAGDMLVVAREDRVGAEEAALLAERGAAVHALLAAA